MVAVGVDGGPDPLGKAYEPSYHQDAMSLLLSPVAGASEARRRALRRRQTVSAWDDSSGRIGRCARSVAGGYVVIRAGTRGHYVASLLRCGSAWSCPVCAPAIRWKRELRLRAALEAYQGDTGGVVRMVTLTVPHRAGDSLAGLLDGLTRAWSQVVAGRRWTLAQARYGIAGWLRAVEVTVGSHGWHPHLHVLVLVAAGCDEAALGAWLTERWRAACSAAGLRVPSRERGVDLRDVGASAAGYLTAMSTEALRGDVKLGRAGSVAPLQLLDLAGTEREAWARARWCEYAAATRGRHTVASSRGLRRWLGRLDASDPLASDGDAAADAVEDTAGRGVLWLTREQWRALRRTPAGVANILTLLDAGRADRVAELLGVLTPTAVSLGEGFGGPASADMSGTVPTHRRMEMRKLVDGSYEFDGNDYVHIAGQPPMLRAPARFVQLATSGDRDDRYRAAEDARLAEQLVDMEQGALAGEMLMRLAEDPDPGVRVSAATNPYLPSFVRDLLASEGAKAVGAGWLPRPRNVPRTVPSADIAGGTANSSGDDRKD